MVHFASPWMVGVIFFAVIGSIAATIPLISALVNSLRLGRSHRSSFPDNQPMLNVESGSLVAPRFDRLPSSEILDLVSQSVEKKAPAVSLTLRRGHAFQSVRSAFRSPISKQSIKKPLPRIQSPTSIFALPTKQLAVNKSQFTDSKGIQKGEPTCCQAEQTHYLGF